ncbi:MAG: SCO1664 family protein [Chloroflexota bacterium]
MARKDRRAERAGMIGRQPADTSWAPDDPRVVPLLGSAVITQCRPIMWGSNGTFLITMNDQEGAGQSHAVYKPRRGESPLWDFPRGSLYKREVGTYLVSDALGWGLVPPTVARNGPYGMGSVQLFIEHDTEEYFRSPTHRDPKSAEAIALLDLILNNADRKTEHCLQGLDGRTWAIDHGLTFHIEPKLRTVIWDFAGQPIRPDLLEDLRRLPGALRESAPLYAALGALICDEEIMAVRRRVGRLLKSGCHPDPGTGRRAQPWAFW